tara:strand:- start:516 stop:869 length:354 start_codon:yes stop_codon:yes gene_type:complete
MKHGSLFSGIGGFDLAAEWIGWENIFHCEWNPFSQKILKHHFPKSISYDDIKKTDFSIHKGAIDIISGGDDGLPKELDGITFSKWRQESIKAYGNAIVPQVAYQIFKAIQMQKEMPG